MCDLALDCMSYLEVQHGVKQVFLHGLGHEEVHAAVGGGRRH